VRLLRDDEVPAPPAVESYQETAWPALVVGLLLLVSAAALVAWPLAEEGWRLTWIVAPLGLSALIVFLIARFALRSFLASRRPESWRLRWDAEGIYLRYRSHLNNRFPADTPAAVYLPRREVAWLKVRRETLDTPDEHGRWGLKRSHRWFEVGLRGLDPAPIEAALSDEAKLRGPRGWRANDFPVAVTPQGTLRVGLRNPEAVLARLRRYYPVALAEETESGAFESMSREEKESHILALAAAGDNFAAIKAARELYGLDLTEAKTLVDELQGR
jgi:hypothetical protein